MTDLSPAALLARYDDQLRGGAELSAGDQVERHGPLWWAVLRGAQGFVTYRDLGGADRVGVRRLVAQTVEHYRSLPGVTRLEWKSRGHDEAPGLHEALVAHGFVAAEAESVMIGRAEGVAAQVPLPDGVVVRRATSAQDVRAACACADEGFGRATPGMAEALLARLAADPDGLEVWLAEADGVPVCTGRLEPVPGTDFAGLWGGATVERWRHRGVYRALTAARARSALARGMTLLQSDSTPHSRPVLERSGFVRVTTTTPYEIDLSR